MSRCVPYPPAVPDFPRVHRSTYNTADESAVFYTPSQVFVRLPTKQPTPQAEGGAWPLLSRDGCSRMWAEARRALPRLTTRRPFFGGGVGWEAAAGGRVSTPEVRRQGLVGWSAGRTSKNLPRDHVHPRH
eukprot:scaffold14715_cov112-Isochrysis_galbana.AAC.3